MDLLLLTSVAGGAAEARAAAVVEPVLPHAAMRYTQPQPYEEQGPHGYELHEEVAAVRQCCTQDGGQLVRALDDAVHLLEERAANGALQGVNTPTAGQGSANGSNNGPAVTVVHWKKCAVVQLSGMAQGSWVRLKPHYGSATWCVPACSLRLRMTAVQILPAGTCCTRPSRRRWLQCAAPERSS